MSNDSKDSAIVVIPEAKGLDSYLTYLTPEHKRFRGRYRLPGGKLKVREDYESALRRELNEEYGIGLDDLVLHYQKPNVLGGTIYLCSGQRNGSPSPKEPDVGAVEWMDAEKIFSSNMVPNCKIAVYAYLLENNPDLLKKLIPIIYEDNEFLEIIQSEAESLYNGVLV